ncbi:hypothetical protein [Cellulomonas alba]|uniref:Uncharacterized protein n=1 Tax=Cellulomonas alba TaxID=3053467 RepID=A0ABT7SEY5_9CELL|nr:hypothetical protein [Cellulomonas alba]MDM7854754.1 hypothetical protein [Cellulomonas alba]
MSIDLGSDGPALPHQLRDRWHDASVASVWRRPADWYHPAVDALALALLTDDDAEPFAHELGRARGKDGVGIGETIDDLGCLYRATGRIDPPTAVVRALCEGWADGQAATVVTGAAVDATSGLPSRPYLAVRLAEEYAGPSPRGALLVVDAAVAELPPWSVSVRSATVGRALLDTYGHGHPMAAVGGGVFAVLVRPGDDSDGRAHELRVRIAHLATRLRAADALRHPLRVRLVPLPADLEDAVALLDRNAHTG